MCCDFWSPLWDCGVRYAIEMPMSFHLRPPIIFSSNFERGLRLPVLEIFTQKKKKTSKRSKQTTFTRYRLLMRPCSLLLWRALSFIRKYFTFKWTFTQSRPKIARNRFVMYFIPISFENSSLEIHTLKFRAMKFKWDRYNILNTLICLPSISLGLKVHLKINELTNQVIFYQIMFIIWKCNIHTFFIVFCLAQIGVTSTKSRVFTLDLA